MERDLGKELMAALASKDTAENAVHSTFLLLLNTLQLAEPDPSVTKRTIPLKNEIWPSGAVHKVLNVLEGHRKTVREIDAQGFVITQKIPDHAGLQARSTFRGLALLLQYERCNLAARSSERDNLVRDYITSRPKLSHYENLSKGVQRWRQKMKRAGFFESSGKSRAFMRSCMIAMLGSDGVFAIQTPDDPKSVDALLKISARTRTHLEAKIPDSLELDVLCSLFDFTLHNRDQISNTLKSLQGASVLPPDFGVLPKITGDILPPGLFQERA